MSQQNDVPDPASGEMPGLKQSPRSFLGLGLGLIVLGLGAIAAPWLAQLVFVVILGVILIIGGAGKLWHALRQPRWGAFLLSLAVSTVYLGAGLLMLFYPFSGILALTILLAAFLVVKGALKTAAAWHLRPREPWGWVMFSGVLSLILGLLIWSGLPGTALWVIGLLIGVDLVFTGLTMVAFYHSLREG